MAKRKVSKETVVVGDDTTAEDLPTRAERLTAIGRGQGDPCASPTRADRFAAEKAAREEAEHNEA